MSTNTLSPDRIFEISWEICNKIGGINTVVSTKAYSLINEFHDNFMLIGPDLWRETRENPVFTEDKNLMKSWRERAAEEGIRIRVGRWKIIGEPVVILVDFTTFISHKDDIFKRFWETYKLDSITGGMDYIEAAVFGYAAGKVIESYYRYNLSARDKIIAHFHEWMTGAGILYLHKNLPQIATVFTTHATMVGRSIAGHGQPLYDMLPQYNGDSKARELGVVAKQSMEKLSAQTCDCFTTVSDITARECKQFLEKPVDIVTPNGFEDNFVPVGEEFDKYRTEARQSLIKVAETLLGYELEDDAILIANSGRYEFRNKGIDIFIQSMGNLNTRSDLNKQVVAFILVPTSNYGPRTDLQNALNNGQNQVNNIGENRFLTHGLHDAEYDEILNEIKATNLANEKDHKVKVIYAPCYLDGEDGIFNKPYYDILIGFDITIFPSYYEPWGYTPLESIAFHIPTITTNLAGIGMWINTELVNVNDGIEVFERKVGKDQNLIRKICDRVVLESNKSAYDRQRARENAYSISRIALWKNLIKYYKQAYHIALSKVEERPDRYVEVAPLDHIIPSKPRKSNRPHWRELVVQTNLPTRFNGLQEISKNLWWSWNFRAAELFRYIDEELWEKHNHNPILLLKEVSYERLKELEEEEQFIFEYNTVYNRFKKYVQEKKRETLPRVAYFSMEYGLNDIIKIFSGGLGLLAGDYLKEASDSKVDMVGIGFLYRYGYFTQQLSLNGEQLATYEPQNFTNLPITPETDQNGELIIVQVAFPGRIVYAKVWRVDVGRIPLYLLDTDFELNSPEDRSITHQLYGGDNENRLKQEMLLGVGGIRALNALGIERDVFHCNEGHAAFISIERLRRLINEKNLTFAESLEIVRVSTLFTTHTPVPAGHDAFPEDLMMVYMGHYPERLKINWEEFMNLGRMNPGDKNEKFSMSHLAVNASQEVNGVSKLHGEVTKQMFKHMWEGYFTDELHIGYVTNGVHLPSWIAQDWKNMYIKEFGKEFLTDQSNKDYWTNIYKVADKEIWNLRQKYRKILIDYIRDRLSSRWIRRHVDPKTIVKVKNRIDENTLTIGFARRFATYKRAHLLFEDIERLAKILNNKDMPVQFIFAGKAHPADGGGQGLIKKIVEISNRPEFLGHIIFLENYDIEVAKKLVQGVDIWLNTPTRPLEASGTSGMKAVINGVLNFSVLDGWWVEGYREGAGWALPQEKTYQNQEFQDDLDAETIYTMFEQNIIPMFYKRDENNIPTEWIRYIKNCIAEIVPEFTTKRMIDDYIDRFYTKLFDRTKEMRKHGYAMAKRISSWKKKVARGWDDIEILEYDFFPSANKEQLILGKKYKGKVVVDLKDLNDVEVGIEVIVTESLSDGSNRTIRKEELELESQEGTIATYTIELQPTRSGVFHFGLRMFPKNSDLPHRQDFSFVRWI